MKKKHAKKAAKKIIKVSLKNPQLYSDSDVKYAELILSSFKKKKQD
jgi:hypothetical protein